MSAQQQTKTNSAGLSTRRSKTLLSFIRVVPLGLALYIITGEIIQTGISPLEEYAGPALILAMSLLFVVEGAELAVAILDTRDLEPIKGEHHRAYSLVTYLHARRATAPRFFKGRQVAVIVLVFITADATTFPTAQSLPFINFNLLSSPLTSWFCIIFLRAGISGALLVAWVSQITPKLIAQKNPVGFLEFPLVEPLCKLAVFLDSIGLAAPSTKVASLFKDGEPLPFAPKEVYEGNKRRYGYGVVSQEIHEGYSKVEKGSSLRFRRKVTIKKSYSFVKSGIPELVVAVPYTGTLIGFEATSAYVVGSSSGEAPVDCVVGRYETEGSETGELQLVRVPLRCPQGTFNAGDKVFFEGAFTFRDHVSTNTIITRTRIEEPIERLQIRATWDGVQALLAEANIHQPTASGAKVLPKAETLNLSVENTMQGAGQVDYGRAYPYVGETHEVALSITNEVRPSHSSQDTEDIIPYQPKVLQSDSCSLAD